MTNTTEDPHPTPRPQDPFTAQDGARLFQSITGELKKISASLTTISGTLANVLQKEITSLEQMARIEEGLSGSRITRLEQEVREAEIEVERAELAKRAAEEKLRLKSEVKENNIDTQERLRRIAATQYEDLEKQRRAESDAFKQDLKRGAIKAIVNGLAFSGALAFLGFIWFLIQLYINRIGP